MQENILTWFITAAGGGLTWFVYTLSNRVTALEVKDDQRRIDGEKIDRILAELSDLKQIINVHINQDRIEKEHLREEIAEMKREIEELIRQKSNVR